MSTTAIAIILTIDTLVLFLTVFSEAIWKIIRLLIDFGFIKEHNFLAKKLRLKEISLVGRVLQELRIPNAYSVHMNRAMAWDKYYSLKADYKLSVRVLHALQRACKNIHEEGFWYSETGRLYIDVMGKMFEDRANPDESRSESIYASLMEEWINTLIRENVIERPDCIISNKDGNLELARQTCDLLNSSEQPTYLIATKGVNDRSRIERSNKEHAHKTDFEGLDAIINANDALHRKLNVLFIDDSFTGAVSLTSTIRSFNSYVKSKQLPFNQITNAVVLFAIHSDKARHRLNDSNLKIHSVVAFDQSSIREFSTTANKELLRQPGKYKNGYFACAESERLDV